MVVGFSKTSWRTLLEQPLMCNMDYLRLHIFLSFMFLKPVPYSLSNLGTFYEPLLWILQKKMLHYILTSQSYIHETIKGG